VELQDYVRILLKNWILVVLMTMLAGGAAVAYSLLTPPSYVASAKVFVSTSGATSAADLQQGSSFTVQRVKTYADLVKTTSVLQPTIERLGLELTPKELRGQVSASVPLSTTVINIAVTDGNAVHAAELATAIAEELGVVVERIEATGSSEDSPVRLSVVQEAEVPTVPAGPRTKLNIALGVILGFAFGVALALIRETMDTRIRNEQDIAQITEIPILGGIVFDSRAKERPLIVQVEPHSPRVESFRSLRTNLRFLDAGRKDRSFVITSSVPTEGKSTTAANLAITMSAAGGERVLLVDADLRRPRIDQYMQIEGGVGLTDVIIGRLTLSDAIQRWGQTELYILPCGQIPPNPSELLGSQAMEQIIAELASNFDVVLYDAPPLLPFTDAAVLARLVGGSLVIVAAGRTHRNQLAGSLNALENVGARVSGLVLTMVPTKGPDAYGYGRYGYGNYYRHEQGEASKKQ
jgi:capsular exopolysaccharide synthesis family protein